MTTVGKLAQRFAGALVGWRLHQRDLRARREEAQQVLAGLALDRSLRARDWAKAVEKAAARCLGWQQVVRAVALVLLAAVVLVGGGYAVAKYGWPWPGVIFTSQATPVPTEIPPTEVPTPVLKEASWIFSGQVYRQGTREGLAGATVYLDVLSEGGWQPGAASDVSGQDGSFSLPYELPGGFAGKVECQLRVELPPGWNHIARTQGRGWNWSNGTPYTVTGSFSSSEAIKPVTFEAAIRRTFAGTVYFEGEGAPDSATVQLRYQDEWGQWLDAGAETVEKKPPEPRQHIVEASFTLEHISVLEDVKYQVSIASPPGTEVQDWAAGAPPDVGQVEGSAVIVSPGQKTEVVGILFAGPLPITLTYETADFDPAYDPSNPGIWRDESVPQEVTYPFATRAEQNVPRGARARWPVYLPGGNAYEIWVAIPGLRSSAVVSYTLFSDEGGRPGTEIPGGVITEVMQCRNDQEGDEWVLATTYPPEAIGAGDLFWLVVDESRAYWPEGCVDPDGIPYQFRMPVWQVEVRRGQQ